MYINRKRQYEKFGISTFQFQYFNIPHLMGIEASAFTLLQLCFAFALIWTAGMLANQLKPYTESSQPRARNGL